MADKEIMFGFEEIMFGFEEIMLGFGIMAVVS
jgi:hypothetical protein